MCQKDLVPMWCNAPEFLSPFGKLGHHLGAVESYGDTRVVSYVSLPQLVAPHAPEPRKN